MLLRSRQPPGGLTMSKVSKVLAFLTRMKVNLQLISAHVFFYHYKKSFFKTRICLKVSSHLEYIIYIFSEHA